MFFYIARRLAWTVVVIACVIAITFAVFFLLPSGDPALRFAGKNPTDAELAQIHQRLGLDDPFYVQFGRFTWHFFTGDKYGWPGLGYTYASGSSVKGLIMARAPRTLFLIMGAAIIWLILGVSIGVLSAVKRRSVADRAAMGFALFGISTPVFWLGLVALYIFWRQLGWVGGSGYVSPLESVTGFFSHMITPWIVLALLYAATYARMTRNSLLETLGEDYIRTARAKGLPERTVIFKHGLRASLTPIVTMFGLDIALLVGGAVITESVFNLQGLGYLAINDALQQDLPVVLGVVLVASVAVALANLLVDILYAFIDPRVRYA
ncbi:MAG TPA: ABC transporter permease [Gaiellaceae bacterium]|jgi:peptide/nickel transport system permease protein|nr:ABC transporter permease [Gaiellaceae bacterium]